MTSVNELVAWLHQQIDHDEQVSVLVGRAFSGDWSEHRRRVVVQCEEWLLCGPGVVGVDGSGASFPEAAEVILRLLAVPYSDRNGYRDEWRPT
jgi:hypothetical protein